MGDAVTLAPGIHELAADDYHADLLTDTPTLSASIAKLLVSKSPAHARAAHPKLNPDLKREESDKFDIGTCAHELLLRGVSIVDVIAAKDWRTDDAKAQREASRRAGRIPLLPPQAESVLAMVDSARIQIAEHSARPPLFTNGKPEQTLIWEDDHGVVCRARLDWLHDDYSAIDDLKTTSASADPGAWVKTAYGIGADLQVAMYERGVERLTGTRPVFRYVVVETYPPFALSVVDLAPAALAFARDKVQVAIDKWAECLERDEWPAYDRRVASMEIPTWAEFQWLEREQEAAA